MQARFAAELARGVGIGLDAGEAIPVEGGYRGSALNLAARLCGQAGPGETLASEAVIHLAAKVDGIGYTDPRIYRLKGIDEAVRAVHVVAAEKAAKGPIRYGREGRLDRRLLATLGVGALALVLATLGLSGAFVGRSAASPGPTAAAAGSPSASPDLFATADLPAIAWVDPVSGKVTDSRRTETQIIGGGLDDGTISMLGVDPFVMFRVDPTSHRTIGSIPIPLPVPGGMDIDHGVLWVTDGLAPRVVGIDRATGVQVHDYSLTGGTDDRPEASSVTVGAGSVWVGLGGRRWSGSIPTPARSRLGSRRRGLITFGSTAARSTSAARRRFGASIRPRMR